MIISFFPWPKCHIYGGLVFAVFLFFVGASVCFYFVLFFIFWTNRITLHLRFDRPSWAKRWNSVVVLLIFSSKHRECLYLLKGTETFSSPFFHSIILKTDGEAPAMLICITNIYCLFQLWKDVLTFWVCIQPRVGQFSK